jgi:hypothetical protein
MSSPKLLATLVFFSVSCGMAEACVCGTMPEKAEIAQWVEDRRTAATYVFLGRITQIIKSERKPALDTTVKFETLEELKGAPRFPLLSISECHNFELSENDTRVLFVTSEGMICGCTEYRQFISDDQLLSMLRGGLGQNAN